MMTGGRVEGKQSFAYRMAFAVAFARSLEFTTTSRVVAMEREKRGIGSLSAERFATGVVGHYFTQPTGNGQDDTTPCALAGVDDATAVIAGVRLSGFYFTFAEGHGLALSITCDKSKRGSFNAVFQ
jgi:hypothetical protein